MLLQDGIMDLAGRTIYFSKKQEFEAFFHKIILQYTIPTNQKSFCRHIMGHRHCRLYCHTWPEDTCFDKTCIIPTSWETPSLLVLL